MKQSEKIAEKVLNDELKKFINDLEEFMKSKGHHLGFHEQIAVIEYFIHKNNKHRNHDRAILSFRKLKGVDKK